MCVRKLQYRESDSHLTDFLYFTCNNALFHFTGTVPNIVTASDTQEGATRVAYLHNVRFNILLRNKMRRQAVCGRARCRTSVYLATA